MLPGRKTPPEAHQRNGLGTGTPTWSQVDCAGAFANGLVVGQFAAVDSAHSALMSSAARMAVDRLRLATTTGATEPSHIGIHLGVAANLRAPPGLSTSRRAVYDSGSNRLIISNGWGCGLFNELWILYARKREGHGFTPTWMNCSTRERRLAAGRPCCQGDLQPRSHHDVPVEGGSPSVPICGGYQTRTAGRRRRSGDAGVDPRGDDRRATRATAVGGVAYDGGERSAPRAATVGSVMHTDHQSGERIGRVDLSAVTPEARR